MTADFKHCDDYIDDPAAPECLRKFLDHARAPAHGSGRDVPRPALFATFNGERVRVVMASRLGDVGITSNLTAQHGYDRRVAVNLLADFSADAQGTSGSAQDPQGLDPKGAGPVSEGNAP